jgi:mannose-6-phosphate isomerase-like protein (cupin superfamily)
MNRRQFMKFPLVAAALTLDAKAGGGDRSPEGFSVKSNEDRFAEDLRIMGGRFCCKVSGRDTEGELCIYDTVRKSKGGPALHLHHFQDEWFYVIRGEFVVKVGESTVNLLPGDSAFAPRRIPHTFANIGEGEGQLLIVFQPAGRIEDFFKEMARFGEAIPKNQEVLMKELFERYGMEIAGPPLSF